MPNLRDSRDVPMHDGDCFRVGYGAVWQLSVMGSDRTDTTSVVARRMDREEPLWKLYPLGGVYSDTTQFKTTRIQLPGWKKTSCAGCPALLTCTLAGEPQAMRYAQGDHAEA